MMSDRSGVSWRVGRVRPSVGAVVVLRIPDPAPIRPDGGSSRVIGVIANVHGTWANVVLAHSFHEMATDHDVFVHGVTPYTLVLMGELYAQAWATQIERVLGFVPIEAVQAAWRAIHDDGESASSWNNANSPHGTPLPLAGPSDPRWSWLEGWLPTSTALSSSVRRTVLDGGPPEEGAET